MPLSVSFFDPKWVFRVLCSGLLPVRYFKYLVWPLTGFGALVAYQDWYELQAHIDRIFLSFNFAQNILLGLLTANLLSMVMLGATMAFYQIDSRQFGIRLMFGFFPRFYVERAQIKKLNYKGQRACYCVPLLTKLTLFAFGMIMWAVLRRSGTGAADMALAIGVVGMTAFVFTANPLFPADGYRWMAAFFKRPSLQMQAFRVMGMVLRRRPLPSALNRAEATVLVIFAVSSIVFTAVIIFWLLSSIGLALEAQFEGTGVILFCILLSMAVLFLVSLRQIHKPDAAKAQAGSKPGKDANETSRAHSAAARRDDPRLTRAVHSRTPQAEEAKTAPMAKKTTDNEPKPGTVPGVDPLEAGQAVTDLFKEVGESVAPPQNAGNAVEFDPDSFSDIGPPSDEELDKDLYMSELETLLAADVQAQEDANGPDLEDIFGEELEEVNLDADPTMSELESLLSDDLSVDGDVADPGEADQSHRLDLEALLAEDLEEAELDADPTMSELESLFGPDPSEHEDTAIDIDDAADLEALLAQDLGLEVAPAVAAAAARSGDGVTAVKPSEPGQDAHEGGNLLDDGIDSDDLADMALDDFGSDEDDEPDASGTDQPSIPDVKPDSKSDPVATSVKAPKGTDASEAAKSEDAAKSADESEPTGTKTSISNMNPKSKGSQKAAAQQAQNKLKERSRALVLAKKTEMAERPAKKNAPAVRKVKPAPAKGDGQFQDLDLVLGRTGVARAPRSKWRARFVWLVILAGFGYIAFLPYPYEVGGEFIVQPITQSQVRARTDGEIIRVDVEEGDWVEKDQIMAVLSNWDEVRDIAVREAELLMLRAELLTLTSGPRPEAIALAEESVAAAEVQIEIAQQSLDRKLQLYDRGTITATALEAVQGELKLAQSERSEALAALELARTGALDSEIAAAEAGIQRNLQDLDFAKLQLEQTRIRASTDGQIVGSLDIVPVGAYLVEGGLFAILENNREVLAEIEVPETSISDVVIGAQVELKLWSESDVSLWGTVYRIAPRAEEREFGRVIRVAVKVPNPDGTLSSNMTGYAKVTAGEAPVWEVFSRVLQRFFRVEMWSWLP